MVSSNFLTANSYMGMGLESTRGTAASVTTFNPIMDPKVEPKTTWLPDSSFRGSPVQLYDDVPGVRHDEFSGKTYMYADIYPMLLRSILGSTDTVASVGPSLWTHTIGLVNTASVGSQPPSYTIINNSVDATYSMAAGQGMEMSMTFGADAAVETTFTFIGNPFTNPANPAIVESTQHLIPAWNTAASISGVAAVTIENAQLDIKRGTAPIHTIGQQAPYRNWAGPVEVTGKVSLVLDATYSIVGSGLVNALVRDVQPFYLTFTDPVTNYYIQYYMATTQFRDPVVNQGKNYIGLDLNFDAVSNLTNTAAGYPGYSPIQTITSNGVSTSY